MSTYYYGTLYKKRKEDWSIVEKNLDMNCVKNFLDGWEIEANEVYSVDEKLKEISKNNEFFYTYKFIGNIKKEKLTNTDIEDFIAQGETYMIEEFFGKKNSKKSIPLVFYEGNFEELKSIIEDIDKEDLNEDYYSIYVRLKNYYNGKFYKSSSFDEIIKSSREKLNEITENKRKWENIKSSLDYLKLTDIEKENVWKSFEYEVEDEDNYYKYRLQSAEMLKYTLLLFSDTYNDLNDDVYFYIYSDEDYRLQDIPTWLEDKVARW